MAETTGLRLGLILRRSGLDDKQGKRLGCADGVRHAWRQVEKFAGPQHLGPSLDAEFTPTSDDLHQHAGRTRVFREFLAGGEFEKSDAQAGRGEERLADDAVGDLVYGDFQWARARGVRRK